MWLYSSAVLLCSDMQQHVEWCEIMKTCCIILYCSGTQLPVGQKNWPTPSLLTLDVTMCKNLCRVPLVKSFRMKRIGRDIWRWCYVAVQLQVASGCPSECLYCCLLREQYIYHTFFVLSWAPTPAGSSSMLQYRQRFFYSGVRGICCCDSSHSFWWVECSFAGGRLTHSSMFTGLVASH